MLMPETQKSTKRKNEKERKKKEEEEAIYVKTIEWSMRLIDAFRVSEWMCMGAHALPHTWHVGKVESLSMNR